MKKIIFLALLPIMAAGQTVKIDSTHRFPASSYWKVGDTVMFQQGENYFKAHKSRIQCYSLWDTAKQVEPQELEWNSTGKVFKKFAEAESSRMLAGIIGGTSGALLALIELSMKYPPYISVSIIAGTAIYVVANKISSNNKVKLWGCYLTAKVLE